MIADLVEHTIKDPEERIQIRAKIDEKGPFVPQLHKELDHDGDGKVTYDDFVKSYHKILNNYLSSH